MAKQEKKSNQIGCSVESCEHHVGSENCCCLNSIDVGCCNCVPSHYENTCCRSFKVKKSDSYNGK
ncbi:MAG: DUF1540 domain-containing protein [Clostridiales bacterium]|nr:DUF1540 domain-containing protein [Clostridiales bacterium]